MKDLTSSIAGVRLTRGSRFFADTPPATADSEHVQRLRRAGLVIFGRTNTCELGLSLTCEPQLYGPTRNPWDVTRISGGSSGGAAAVGARMLPLAHASDGFGSIRAPPRAAAWSGLKPTRSRNTFAPFFGEGLGGLSTEHAVSLSLRDSAALLDATCGHGLGDPYVAPSPARPYLQEVRADPGKLRIAWTAATPNGAKVEAEALRVLAETVALCTDLGHHVEERSPDIEGAALVPTFLTFASATTVVNLASHPTAGRRRAGGGADLSRRSWASVSAVDYLRATQTAHRRDAKMACSLEWDVADAGLPRCLQSAGSDMRWMTYTNTGAGVRAVAFTVCQHHRSTCAHAADRSELGRLPSRQLVAPWRRGRSFVWGPGGGGAPCPPQTRARGSVPRQARAAAPIYATYSHRLQDLEWRGSGMSHQLKRPTASNLESGSPPARRFAPSCSAGQGCLGSEVLPVQCALNDEQRCAVVHRPSHGRQDLRDLVVVPVVEDPRQYVGVAMTGHRLEEAPLL
jgi:hypothetical protein